MQILMVVWLSISIILAIRTANLYNGGLPHLCFFAKREIKKGTELTFNCNWIKERGKGTKCFCGDENCSGYIEK
jgi:hypothetical protein